MAGQLTSQAVSLASYRVVPSGLVLMGGKGEVFYTYMKKQIIYGTHVVCVTVEITKKGCAMNTR